jgi:hypothetical protein
MKTTAKARRLLAQLAQIQEMERGKVCRMKDRDHYNHQTWQDGRNVVRYVHRDDVPALKRAIDGYNHFMRLVQNYADEIVRLSRQEREKTMNQKKSRADRGKGAIKKKN